jgi:hypothetical protein
MGIVTGLLFLPVTGPVRAFNFLLQRIHDEAQAVLHDEGRAFAELIDLSMRHNAGMLSDVEFAEQEAALLERLGSIREYRDELLQSELDVQGEEEEEEEEEPFDADPDANGVGSRDADADVDEEGR